MIRNELAVECLLFYPLIKHDNVSLDEIVTKLHEFRHRHDISEFWAPFTRREIIETRHDYAKYIGMEWVKGTQTFGGGWTFIKKDPDCKFFSEEWCDKVFIEPWIEEDIAKDFKATFMNY